MPRPDYTKYNWCNICEIAFAKDQIPICTNCGYRIRTVSRNKKKESMVKRIE